MDMISRGKSSTVTFRGPPNTRRLPDEPSLVIDEVKVVHAQGLLAAVGKAKMDAHFCVLDEGGHIKFFSVKTLSTLLQKHGFTDLKFNFYGRAPLLWKNMICHGHNRA